MCEDSENSQALSHINVGSHLKNIVYVKKLTNQRKLHSVYYDIPVFTSTWSQWDKWVHHNVCASGWSFSQIMSSQLWSHIFVCAECTDCQDPFHLTGQQYNYRSKTEVLWKQIPGSAINSVPAHLDPILTIQTGGSWTWVQAFIQSPSHVCISASRMIVLPDAQLCVCSRFHIRSLSFLKQTCHKPTSKLLCPVCQFWYPWMCVHLWALYWQINHRKVLFVFVPWQSACTMGAEFLVCMAFTHCVHFMQS